MHNPSRRKSAGPPDGSDHRRGEAWQHRRAARGSPWTAHVSWLRATLPKWQWHRELSSPHASSIVLGPWVRTADTMIDWAAQADALSASLVLLVQITLVTVMAYSKEYMAADPHIPRFFAYLSGFAAAMNVLVTSANAAVLFMGWELVGLASYLLIGFWYTRHSANQAALKAVLVNRIGDYGLFIFMMILLALYRTTDWGTLVVLLGYSRCFTWQLAGVSTSVHSALVVGVLLATAGKSAQLALHCWLADAMEGPTPVSALLHAATMIVAGAAFAMRFTTCMSSVPSLSWGTMVLGTMTALLANMLAVGQCDLKRIIAYSTCAHVGMMVCAVGTTVVNAALFHLTLHAFAKASLFMTAGCIIHGSSNEQDLRRLSSIVAVMPVSHAILVLSTVSLLGWPFLSGSFSKDAIIHSLWVSSQSQWHHAGTWGAATILVVCIGLSSYYSWRLISGTSLEISSTSRCAHASVHPDGIASVLPLVALLPGSLICGYVLSDLFMGNASDVLPALFGELPLAYALALEAIPGFYRMVPPLLVVMLIGAIGLWALWLHRHFSAVLRYSPVRIVAARAVGLRFHWDLLYAMGVVGPGLSVALLLCRLLDGGWLQHLGAAGISAIATGCYGRSAVILHSGRVAIHLASIAGALALWLLVGTVAL
nr:NADH dehydrogenase subunit 5 [Rufusia pilicola]